MWFLYVLSWVSLLVQLAFATIAIASALYYLAELVEEYTVISKQVIFWMTVFSLAIYFGLLVLEDLPTPLLVCGIVSHLNHFLILNTFPFVVITSIPFISAVILFVLNHYLAFSFFNSNYYSFSEVMTYFTLCLWLVPFALFISLSANENVLPTVAESSGMMGYDNDVVSHYFSRRAKKYGLLTFFHYAKESILPQRTKKAF